MMSKKTKADKEKKEDSLKEENQVLKNQNLILQDRMNLGDSSYYRQQILSLLERVAVANERQANALEESLENSDEENEDED